ncbi:MAG TPA: carbon-nitrogen hydrolase family protein [Anaerolineae bacterium]|nr:carbon-nitrogen hydrolase family protein [Anaerolineae bacterium]HQH38827.1 carbon-nitrogen hydrolase family protein [Anaerolineae bacterium]
MVTFALAVNRVSLDAEANLNVMVRMAQTAADGGADVILFPEAALTGLINNDDPTHDWPLGQPVPGPATEVFAAVARARQVWLGFGLLERDGARLYDTAVLLSPTGEIALKYRRISPGWHGRRADPAVYAHGIDISAVQTPWGKAAFLLCGDLFDDNLVQQVRMLELDWLLFPFARGFDDGTWDQARWEHYELHKYAARVRVTGVTMLLVNYLCGDDLRDDGTFGGAWVISGIGEVLAQQPLGQDGLLLVTL